jgi:tRNA(Ile)-lysidine synthase
VLMKLLRGAWMEGLSGIHPVLAVAETHISDARRGAPGSGAPARAGKIVRPLLRVRRVELEEYLRRVGQEWRTDSSNDDEAFTRNRVRHHLLPILREYNPGVDGTLANLAELAREDEARWQVEMARVLPQILLPGKPVRGGGRSVSTAVGGDSVAIEIERLRGCDAALRRRVVRGAARSLGVRLGFDDTARLLGLAGLAADGAVSAKVGAALHLPGGLRAERSARELRLHRESGVDCALARNIPQKVNGGLVRSGR